jgi:hypothetical protein
MPIVRLQWQAWVMVAVVLTLAVSTALLMLVGWVQ